MTRDKEGNGMYCNKATIIGARFEPNKMHIYDVKTTGKHPVHLVDGGSYLTEDKGSFGNGDMGWFFLNQREYDYFKSKCGEVSFTWGGEYCV